MFKSSSHFEFIFVYDVRVCSNLIDLHMLSSFPNTICWRDFAPLYTLTSFVEDQLTKYEDNVILVRGKTHRLVEWNKKSINRLHKRCQLILDKDAKITHWG